MDGLGDRAVALEQGLGRLLEELRVGAQVGEELGQRALEAGLRLELLHLGADSRDFLQADVVDPGRREVGRSEEHTSELHSLMRISYAVFCLNKQNRKHNSITDSTQN